MRRTKLLGLVLSAIMVAGALGAAVSQAATPELLPEATAAKPITFTGASVGEVFLEDLRGDKLACKKITGKASATSLKLGTITLVFEGCNAGQTCTGLGDKAGNITVEGEFHIFAGILIKSKTEVVVMAILLPKRLHYNCFGGLILYESKENACLAEQITPVEKLVTTLTMDFVQGNGDTDIVEVAENLKGKFFKCTNMLSVNGSGEEGVGWSGEVQFKNFLQGGFFREVLIDA